MWVAPLAPKLGLRYVILESTWSLHWGWVCCKWGPVFYRRWSRLQWTIASVRSLIVSRERPPPWAGVSSTTSRSTPSCSNTPAPLVGYDIIVGSWLCHGCVMWHHLLHCVLMTSFWCNTWQTTSMKMRISTFSFPLPPSFTHTHHTQHMDITHNTRASHTTHSHHTQHTHITHNTRASHTTRTSHTTHAHHTQHTHITHNTRTSHTTRTHTHHTHMHMPS